MTNESSDPNVRLETLRTMPYEDYLETPEWQAQRQHALERAEQHCQICYSPDNLDVHHRTYERRGNERLSDLTVLCRSCHYLHHAGQRLRDAQHLLVPGVELLQEAIQVLDRERATITGTPTGFRDLDYVLGGIHRGDLFVLAGRPRTGKSTFALNVARNAAKSGRKVLFFSLETESALLSQRLIALGSGVQGERLQTALLKDADWENITYTMGEVSELPLWVCDAAELSPQDMRAYLAQFMNQAGEESIGLVVIDGLNLVGAAGSSQRAYALQHTQNVVREFKVMARALSLPVLLTCQVSPKAEARIDQVPELTDLQPPGSVEDYADVICFLHREEIHDPSTERKGLIDIIVAKNRHGMEGFVTLYYHPSIYRFRDLEPVPSEQK